MQDDPMQVPSIPREVFAYTTATSTIVTHATGFPMWAALAFGYTGFWHVTLYMLGWGKRPFIANRPYNLDKVRCALCRLCKMTTRT